jgi:3-oxoacyl-[acyl-carrier protein] reductase
MTAPAERAIIVTGASRGLGREIALRFGTAGERVVVVFRERGDEAQAVVREIIAAGGDAVAVRADVRDHAAVASMVRTALDRWGSIDVLVNNAGITRDDLAVRMGEQDWDDVLGTNLKGPFLCIQEVSRIMMKQRGGHIINISSLSGVRGSEGQVNYSASKAGLLGLTRAVANELGQYSISVNAVLPGYLPTDMGRAAPSAVLERVSRENVLGRGSTAIEVAEFIYRLSLMENVSGQVFNLDSRIV